MENLAGIITGVAAFLTAIGSFYVAYNNRQKVVAEEEKIHSEAINAATVTYTSIIEPMVARIDRLERRTEAQEKRIAGLEAENRELWTGVRVLSEQLQGLGHAPAWEPSGGWK